MEQIYYTQCPMGYGLGVSNGFQIKRRSAGYPETADFQHLGMRAFRGTSRALAPGALRYRRLGGVAEVAWLTPRAREFETERGQWGRPGGVFAHGLRLAPEELAGLSYWPAGLHDRPFWTRSDPEPSRGQPPAPLDLSTAELMVEPRFSAVAPKARDLDPEWLASLLEAAAAAVREDRTLFLIGEADQVAGTVALVTFAFPGRLREALTFSTYHDRPEELQGFRLSGTLPKSQPSRSTLAALGLVADLPARSIEPGVAPARWARTLAGWFVQAEEAAWNATDRLARKAQIPEESRVAWSDEWLDPLFVFHGQTRTPATIPQGVEAWNDLAKMADWANRAGLALEWIPVRRPPWWIEAAETARGLPEARAALVANAGLCEAWQGPRTLASGWGEALAAMFADAPPASRGSAMAALLRAAPAPSRPVFLGAALKTLPGETALEILGRLRAGGSGDESALLSVEARLAAAALLERRDCRPLDDVLTRALAELKAIAPTLDALDAEAGDRPEAIDPIARRLATALSAAEHKAQDEVRAWSLRRGELASLWLAPHLGRLLAPPNRPEDWRLARDGIPEELRPLFAVVLLGAASDDRLPGEAFRWGVEEVLLTIDESQRPSDPAWPARFVDGTPSDLDLIRWLYVKGSLRPELKRWLSQAQAEGALPPAAVARLDRVRDEARALASPDAWALLALDLPSIPAADRGPLLGQLLRRVGGAALEGIAVILDACRHAWPESFLPGAPGLDLIAAPLAEALAPYRCDPETWLERLRAFLNRLGVVGGFEPNGLAAHVAAASMRLEEPGFSPWELRRALLHDDEAWRLLGADAARDLSAAAEIESFRRWDDRLDKGVHSRRFFEVLLNTAAPAALGAIVVEVLADLRTLGTIPWWESQRHPGAADDLRERFARSVPMAPLPADRLPLLRAWLGSEPTPLPCSVTIDQELEPIPVEPSARGGVGGAGGRLSPGAEARWRVLEALTVLRSTRNAGDAGQRRAILESLMERLSLTALDPDDRYRFAAWVILATEDLSDADVRRLGGWLAANGVADAGRLRAWADELEGLAGSLAPWKPLRVKLVADLVQAVQGS